LFPPKRRCSPDCTVSSTDDKIVALLWHEKFTAHRFESVVYSTCDGTDDDDDDNDDDNNRKQ